ncbi:MAG: hypothetical protein JWQ52_1408 [Phenylobacterium sp.]|jgi:hypothetical protein|nr:hypothetical protein [Phenylobacterium sp.]
MRPTAALALAVPLLGALALAACSPGLPKGVDKDKLDEAISSRIGDPNTCVLIGRQADGQTVYRYNTHTVCDRKLPACDSKGLRTVDDLLKTTAKDGQARALSCNTTADASRGVGWASGVLAGHGLVYAAMMEGDRAFPGRMMAERLDGAFKAAGF